MFLRKVTVIIVPLVMLAALCLVSPWLNSMHYFTSGVIRGALIGTALALMLPLAGAIKRREPFGGMLWLPAFITIGLIVCQALMQNGLEVPLLNMLATTDGWVVQTESIFAAYMLTTCIRTAG